MYEYKKLMNTMSESVTIEVHTDENRLTSLKENGFNGKIKGEIQLDETKKILRIVVKPDNN